MAVLVLPVGQTGSGKSYLGNQLKKLTDISIVCMDDLRKQLTDSYSDQSRNQEVWIASQNQLESKIKSGKNVYYSATNLGGSRFPSDINGYFNRFKDLFIVIVPLKDSYDVELCRSRIVDDFDKGIERADTRSEAIINRQQYKFLSTMKTLDQVHSEHPVKVRVIEFDGSNAKEIAETIEALS